MDYAQSKQPSGLTKPSVVLISDTHYSLSTLSLADKAFRIAIDKASELGIPLIEAGDLTNDKAIIRAEVANALINTLQYAKSKGVKVILIVGNHSLINEKGEENALEFLRPYAVVVDTPQYEWDLNLTLIPYQSDPEKLKAILLAASPGRPIIMHQGFMGAAMGDYVVDKTSIDPSLVKDFKVFSGHYHRHQTLGTVTYIGNPYTLSFGEANDGPKGFLVLNDDGTYTREILPLRKHVIAEYTVSDLQACIDKQEWQNTDSSQDLLWLKVTGAQSTLDNLDKGKLRRFLPEGLSFKLDLIPTDQPHYNKPTSHMTDRQVLDSVIDSYQETAERRQYLKELCDAYLKS